MVVLGCGVAGLAAATTAVRQGARVLVVEKTEAIGGKATQSYVGTLCGLYYRRRDQDFNFCSEGFMAEFAKRVQGLSGYEAVSQPDGLAYLPYRLEAMKQVMQTYIEECRLEIAWNSTVIRYGISGSRITQIELGNSRSIETKAVVDAGGNAQTSINQHLAIIEEPNPQQAHLSVAYSVESGSSNPLLEWIYALRKAEMEGLLSPAIALASIIPGVVETNRFWVKVPVLSKVMMPGSTETSLKEEGVRNALLLAEVMRKYAPAFKNTRVAEIASKVGIRTEARNKGKKVLTAEDVSGGIKKEGPFSRGTWPVEIWESGKRVQLEYPEWGDYYTIEDKVLEAESLDNLFFAGRSISADTKAIASARVMGTCLQTGEQSGNLAVKSAQTS